MARIFQSISVDAPIFRVFPHPLVSVLVGCTWIMLQHSLSVGNLVMALLCAWLIPQFCKNFIIRTPDLDWWAAIKLIMVLVWDIVVSNIRMARLILGPLAPLQPKWYRIPLETNHPQVNSLLAMMITTTPGTVSAGIDDERGDILVHNIDCNDVTAEIADIKLRYEQPLIRIFNAPLAERWLPTDELPAPDAPLEQQVNHIPSDSASDIR